MIDKAALIEERINRILTQYRESPNLIALIRNGLQEIADAAEYLEAIQTAFDIETSIGDQLTVIGKWLGWPRVHCEGRRPTVFGFECSSDGEETSACSTAVPVAGFCEGARWACPGYGFEDYEFVDDELYRRYLKARNIKLAGDYSRERLIEAAGLIFDHEVVFVRERPGVVTLCLTRAFTSEELAILALADHVLPIALGVRLEWAQTDGAIFGFGEGWGGLCSSSFYSIVRDPFDRAPKTDVFGFGPDWAEMCGGHFYSGNPADLLN